MNKRILIIGGVILLVIAVIVWLVSCASGGNGASTPTPSVSPQSVIQQTQQAQATNTSGAQPRSTVESVPVAGGSCGTDCVWSRSCVEGLYTIEESPGMGLTRVHDAHPDGCRPFDLTKFYIRPENPYRGMPCSLETVDKCVWSADCVEKKLVAPVRNGLAPVLIGDSICTLATEFAK